MGGVGGEVGGLGETGRDISIIKAKNEGRGESGGGGEEEGGENVRTIKMNSDCEGDQKGGVGNVPC